jgi:hypothetical protein
MIVEHSWEREAGVRASSTPGIPRKAIGFPILLALGGLLSVGPITTELLNIRNPSQATCKVNVIAGIVRVNLSPLLMMRSG